MILSDIKLNTSLLVVCRVTLQATRSCAVEEATCLALLMSRSSVAAPWTRALAASTRACAAAATRRAADTRPSDH